jgi:hypothetical protein
MIKLYGFVIFILTITVDSIHLNNEKDILIQMKENIEHQLQLIDQINFKQINSQSKNFENTIGESVTLMDLHKIDKNLHILNFIDKNSLGLTTDEKILSFYLHNIKQKGKQNAKFVMFLLIATNKNFFVVSEEGKVFFKVDFNYNATKIDFSFDEDSNIVVYSGTDLNVFPININYDENEVI